MKKELPGHIKKAFKSVDHFLPVVDVIVELVDARMPNGSRIKDFVKRLGKTSVIALAKSDLADAGETRRWIDRFRDEGLTGVSLDCRDRSSVKSLAKLIHNAAFTLKPGVKAPARKVRRVMIIGIPNVGKSTLINSLAGRSAARAANMPGVTRSIQWIKLPGELELLDLPGILDYGLLRRGDILRLINTIPGRDEDTYSQSKTLCDILVYSNNQAILPGFIEANSNFDQFVADYARRMNFCARGNEPDIGRAATDIIKRFQSGGFGRVTLERAASDFTELFTERIEPEAGIPDDED
ncbi:MAG TPA: 50S ribosome-binding GTPase [Candidatus Rifleibacterium sp.]|nr:50S ribosome-binding GTPase [Candidatus Rifleibacterium sp.]HPT45503.1 50S ribosome-binding GTPase [Candidatus Rifleibacterium sp.]